MFFIYKDQSRFSNQIKSYVNPDIKYFLNKTLFKLSFLEKKIDIIGKRVIQNQRQYDDTLYRIYEEGIFLNKKDDKKLIINNENFQFITYTIPFFEWGKYGKKPSYYIDSNDENIFLVSGSGMFFKFRKNDIENKNIKIYSIRSNLIDIINYPEFYYGGKLSIKDIYIENNNVYLSYTNKVKENCYNTSVLKGKILEKKIIFENFFENKQCTKNRTQAAGGRIVRLDKDKILLTVGDYGNWKLAQNKDSIFGKIISIDERTKEFKIVSMGHRNPQGLKFIKKNNFIISTEHGPKGGDEVNLINLNDNSNKNYGWPISSYGFHYDGKKREYAPLFKSHKDHGFVEPLIYFTPSIGISEIIKVDELFEKGKNNYYFVSALGYKDQINEGDHSLHLIRIDNLDNNLSGKKIEQITLNERIRDIQLIDNNLLLSLESSPALGLIFKVDN